MISWNTSHHLIFPEQPGTNPSSLLPGEAERQGLNIYTTELGGAGVATFESTKMAKDGLNNALRHAGVIPKPPKTREELGLSAPIFLDMRGSDSYVHAMDSGVYENLTPVGETVNEGEPVGLIHNMDHPSAPAIKVLARQTGIVGVMRGFPRVNIGDLVAVIGKAYESIEDLPG